MSYRAVMRGKEYWRLGTSIFLFDVENPLDIYTLVSVNMYNVNPSCLLNEERSCCGIVINPYGNSFALDWVDLAESVFCCPEQMVPRVRESPASLISTSQPKAFVQIDHERPLHSTRRSLGKSAPNTGGKTK